MSLKRIYSIYVYLVEGREGDISWQHMMERSTPNMQYQALHHEPEAQPFCEQNCLEDAAPELVRDFFWDDDFRPKWDPMLSYFKMLEECPDAGKMIVHWIKKIPFFCSDREYIIGRRIWESGKTYYFITKVRCSCRKLTCEDSSDNSAVVPAFLGSYEE